LPEKWRFLCLPRLFAVHRAIMAKKERADQLLYAQGLAESRERAKRLIMAGQVYVAGPDGERRRVDKPGQPFAADVRFELAGAAPFVSRGAYKLLTALDYFGLDVAGLVCLDAGASTGGFTDCLVQRGAARVYAVDVGKHQLHERLRADPRVISLEGVNLRHAEAGLIPEPVDALVADLAFISLTLVLGPCLRWLKQDGFVAALIKPQFEAGPGGTVRGVVRDEAVRRAAVDKVRAFAEEKLGLALVGVAPSAIKGPTGNQEYMAVWRRQESAIPILSKPI
jgi:23S rRNA (cytidine1920-2'-O)/16S rRNA (cytidine1409-2'-O)-methyltransferase